MASVQISSNRWLSGTKSPGTRSSARRRANEPAVGGS